MNIRALIVGIAVCCSPIWAQIDFSKCGVDQGCFIEPPGCNHDGNDFSGCSAAASFKKVNAGGKDWVQVELMTSIARPFENNKLGPDLGIYVALAQSTDQKMGGDSVFDCIYTPSAKADKMVVGELSYNNKEPRNVLNMEDTQDTNKFHSVNATVIDTMIYCKMQRAADITPSDKIIDPKIPTYLLMTRAPAKAANPPTDHFVTDAHSGTDFCSHPFVSNNQYALSSDSYTNMKSIEATTTLKADDCKVSSDTTNPTDANPPNTNPSDSATTTSPGGASSVHFAKFTILMFTVIGFYLRLL